MRRQRPPLPHPRRLAPRPARTRRRPGPHRHPRPRRAPRRPHHRPRSPPGRRHRGHHRRRTHRPLPAVAALCATHGARLHIDAAYGGGLLFSDRHRPKLDGLDAAHTVTLDLHKLGWQPVAAGLLAVRDPADLTALNQHADYLNADDDTGGLPDLLGRSLRTTRRPDVLKIAVTLKTLGRHGLGTLVDQVCDHAHAFAALVRDHPGLELHAEPTISTVLFRPTGAPDTAVAAIRRRLLTDGHAVLGRARLDGRLWLKTTLLNPHTRPHDLAALLAAVA